MDCGNPSNLLKVLRSLKKSEIREVIANRIKEFEANYRKSNEEIFKELCFCILAANFNAEKSLKIINSLGDEVMTLSKPELAKKLKKLGHRYPNLRAEYIIEARRYKNELKSLIASFDNEEELREWLVKNIKGLGYKEASHFLRNIGFIDFHIINLLAKYDIIKKPRTLTKIKYLEIETILRNIAKNLGVSLAELDLYLWYLETKKILK
ncbi:MAG TPA: N-glycosylase/DNA lyase [Candidatus Altiarchaeales archaeon]|nr:N-glycosylase/DNA lyase [Candidatus Altiarchaeales archaeon]